MSHFVKLGLAAIRGQCRGFQFRTCLIEQPSRVLGMTVQVIAVRVLRRQNRLVRLTNKVLGSCNIRMDSRRDVLR